MKKTIFSLITISLLFAAGCSDEQRALIQQFWGQKLGKETPVTLPPIPEEEIVTVSENAPELAPEVAPTPAAAPKKKRKKAPASLAIEVKEEAIPAYLFLSDTCPWCRKLKQQGFAAKFRRKHEMDVNLKEYEVSKSAEGMREYSKMLRKHKLQGGVPLLIIGNTVIHGYYDDMLARADAAVQKELKRLNRTPGSSAGAASQPAVLSIIMDDEDIKTVAPEADKQQIKRYLNRVQEDNGAMLSSMGQMFSPAVRNQAMLIANTYEQQLKDLAAKSRSFKAFETGAKKIEAEQQQQIDKLVRLNIGHIRK